ncbi:MAG: hypothetical protein RL518_813 [Pseudomonadota bacterium]|jgi:hypothetical protein
MRLRNEGEFSFSCADSMTVGDPFREERVGEDCVHGHEANAKVPRIPLKCNVFYDDEGSSPLVRRRSVGGDGARKIVASVSMFAS